MTATNASQLPLLEQEPGLPQHSLQALQRIPGEKEGCVLEDSWSGKELGRGGDNVHSYPTLQLMLRREPMRTFSASFGLLFVTPAEALLQSAEGEETPGSQTAHKSINLSQSKHKQKAQGYSRYVCGKTAGFELVNLLRKWHLCPHPFAVSKNVMASLFTLQEMDRMHKVLKPALGLAISSTIHELPLCALTPQSNCKFPSLLVELSYRWKKYLSLSYTQGRIYP